MNLEQKNIPFAFILTTLLTLFMPILFPNWRLLFFAPVIIITYYQKSYLASLWTSCLCGIVQDLLSAQTHFGLYACSYTAATSLLYYQRYYFYADSITTLPIMTFFFSALSAMVQWGLVYAFEPNISISWKWIFTDVVYMPVLDCLYGFFVFVFFNLCFGKRSRKGSDYFAR